MKILKIIFIILILISMSAITWDMLAKNQIDPEKIEEAINRLIAAHNASEAAHVGAGESLSQHKTEETIDHPAASVVEDKIGDGEVSLQKLLADHYFVMCCFESLDGWDISGTTLHELGSMRLQTAATINSYNWTQALPYTVIGLDWSKDFFWQSTLKLHSISNQLAWFGVGGLPPDDALSFAGFKVDNSNLYAYIGEYIDDNWEYQEQIISGVSVDAFHVYRIIYNQSEGTISFYVDGVLKKTWSSGLPTTNDDPFAMYYLKTTVAAIKYMTVTDLLYSRPK